MATPSPPPLYLDTALGESQLQSVSPESDTRTASLSAAVYQHGLHASQRMDHKDPTLGPLRGVSPTVSESDGIPIDVEEYEEASYFPPFNSSDTAEWDPHSTSTVQQPEMDVMHDSSLFEPEDYQFAPQEQQQQQHSNRHTHHYHSHHHLHHCHIRHHSEELRQPTIPPRRSSFTALSERRKDGVSDESISSLGQQPYHTHHAQPPSESSAYSASEQTPLIGGGLPETASMTSTTTAAPATTKENVSPGGETTSLPTLSLTGSGGTPAPASPAPYELKCDRYRQRRRYGLQGVSRTGPMHRKNKRLRGAWKKLLWVKQSYPDNYTDTETFLDHLQRNPRLRPYDFWPLMADFTVITQHVCSVVIFLCCFIGIFREKVSPVAVVGWGTVCSILGWKTWDYWVGREEREAERKGQQKLAEALESISSPHSVASSLGNTPETIPVTKTGDRRPEPANDSSNPRSKLTTLDSDVPTPSSCSSAMPMPDLAQPRAYPEPTPISSGISARNHQRLATAKSALLIFCALMGLSPILKSLTKSTTSDSIWAMSCWLLIINIFFFDYGSGGRSPAAKFPASLSTNAALMASTVLASRLPSTTHVFSLTLFSIEVFGLFPVFRRHLRAISWKGHVSLTVTLVVLAGAAIGITMSSSGLSFVPVLSGILLFGIGTALAMGICSWWLISLQKYKNVVIGPWDPARPVLRRRWDY